MSGPNAERGFTLIEVVIAFAIAAAVTLAALRLFGGAFEGSARAENGTLALLAAESKLAELGRSIPLQEGRLDGTLENGLRWSARIEHYRGLPDERLERLPVEAFDVSVTVRWGESVAERVTLRTLRLAPRGPSG